MELGKEHDAVRAVVRDYLEGMVWGDEKRLRRAFHPGALQVGHFGDLTSSSRCRSSSTG